MSNEELIQEAIDRGYLNVTVIKPAHLVKEDACPEVIIPEGVEITVNTMGDVTFKHNHNSNFRDAKGQTWSGMIYDRSKNNWAKIITYSITGLVGRYIKVLRHNLGGNTRCYKVGDYLKILENPTKGSVCHEVEHAHTLNLTGVNNRVIGGDVELMPVGWKPFKADLDKLAHKQLFVFPTKGVCWQPNDALITYLKNRSLSRSEAGVGSRHKGVAWGPISYWGVLESSSQPEYHISQLEPFLPGGREHVPVVPEHLKQRPLTPDECYRLPDNWYIMTTKENRDILSDFLKSKKDEYIGYVPSWEPYIGNCLLYPQHSIRCYGTYGKPDEPGYKEITFEQFKKHVLKEEDVFPEKWCIKTTDDNYRMVNAFMHNNSYAWREYRETWCTSPDGGYFHWPPAKAIPHTELFKLEGYTEITTSQFNKHVLTHTNFKNQFINITNLNQDEKTRESNTGSIKVQRSNLTVRRSDEIRATGLRRSKSQIKVRSDHSYDSL